MNHWHGTESYLCPTAVPMMKNSGPSGYLLRLAPFTLLPTVLATSLAFRETTIDSESDSGDLGEAEESSAVGFALLAMAVIDEEGVAMNSGVNSYY